MFLFPVTESFDRRARIHRSGRSLQGDYSFFEGKVRTSNFVINDRLRG